MEYRNSLLSCETAKKPTKSFKDLEGMKFGKLLAVRFLGRHGGSYRWECKCDCGERLVVANPALLNRHQKSCGCMKSSDTARRKTIHGDCIGGAIATEFNCWAGMIQRCYDENCAAYYLYGERGIAVCNAWRFGDDSLNGYQVFLRDMGRRPSSNHSLDRINVNGNYAPENCRWATAKQQGRNQRRNLKIIIDGVERLLIEVCEEKLLSYEMVRRRLAKGVSVSRALNPTRMNPSWRKQL